MDWTADDQPIWMKTRQGHILSMPYPIECNDNRALVWYSYTSSEFTDMLVDNFDEMLEQSARQPLVCPISLHPLWWVGPIAYANCGRRSSTSYTTVTVSGSLVHAIFAPMLRACRRGLYRRLTPSPVERERDQRCPAKLAG